MELRQLEYFVAVAEEASFTRAAARVHVAQPGVSAQVRRLEDELGQALFDRSGRAVQLTQAGTAMLPYARRAIGAVAGARDAVDELAGLATGEVTIGMITACTSLELMDLLAEFRGRHPGIAIRLREAGSDELLEGLRTGHLDLAWIGVSSHSGDPPGIATRTLVEDTVVAAVAPGHRLAGRSGVTLRALRHEPLVTLVRGTGVRSALEHGCAAAGVVPTVACEATAPHTVAELAARGLGVATLPASVATAYAGVLQTLTLERGRLRSRIALAWRADEPSGPAARVLIDHVRDELPRPDAPTGPVRPAGR
ncbi:HTH-type transcriptional regulator CynR [Paraconexibacter sp. AEG42_29]|uniref:HTH-type transcriptional regulator CynR n=1 Tax=Paraconexibacter sp. AEG42_29 TaxID=2997339 RepID=A0AAU7B1J2_9ACTN